jgi:pimeloyl-ACP methyl ester carboxylesterase
MTDNWATLRTTGGRTLAYTDLGHREGAPVFYFHGLPGSRLDFAGPLGEEALPASGVRLIAVDRPGFGASDFQPRRRYEDWPADTVAVADELGIGRFGVLGYSAGGPYVVACARALPDRLTFAGIVSGVAPAETPDFRRGMAKTDAIMTRLARVAPPLARLAIKQATKTAQGSPEKFSRQFDKDLSPPDLELHRDPVWRKLVRDIFLEATRQGPYGVVHEYTLNATRWGFRFEEVDFPIQLWQGDTDAIVPPHHAEYLTGRLGNAKLTVLDGVGHLHTPARWRDFLNSAAAAHTSPSPGPQAG